LNTAPEVDDKGKGQEPVTRLEAKKAKGERILLPDMSLPYLTNWFFEIGPITGEGVITWQEMAAWERITGVELDPWEAATLRLLSTHWLNMKHEARKPNCPQPMTEQPVEVRDKVSRQFEMMKAFARKR